MAKNNNEQAVKDKIAQFSDKYRPVAERLYELILAANPELKPRLWYGMPGFALSDSSAVLCYFREDKYVTFGFTENASFPEVSNKLSACAWLLTSLDEATEQSISELVKQMAK